MFRDNKKDYLEELLYGPPVPTKEDLMMSKTPGHKGHEKAIIRLNEPSNSIHIARGSLNNVNNNTITSDRDKKSTK